MNKRGFTVVELITTVAMVSVIALLLVRLTISLKEIYIDSDVKTAIISKQGTMTEKIYRDLRTSNLDEITSCGTNCINFVYSNKTKKLKIDSPNKMVTYDNYSIKLPKSSSFGKFVLEQSDSGIVRIKIPIKDRLVKGDFGINITFQSNRVKIDEDIDVPGETSVYVTLDPNGGNLSNTTVIATTGEKYPTLPSPTRSDYTFKGWSIIPGGYTQYEYIVGAYGRTGPGKEYIDTNLKLYDGTSHEIYIDFATDNFYNYNTIYGSSYDDDYFEGWIYENGALAARYNYVRYGSDKVIDYSRHTLDVKGNNGNLSMSVDGVSTGTGTTGAINSNMKNGIFYLFKSGNEYGNYKLYKCKLYKDNALVRDYIPAEKPDGTLGLYDLKNNVFYPNAGEGRFYAYTKVFVNSNTTVTNTNNHTLYAVWKKN